MSQPFSTKDLATALENYTEAAADPHARLWFQKHARLYQDDTQAQPGDPTFFKTYFADNLAPTEEQLRGLTTEAGIKAFREGPILIDVASGNMRIKGTYTIEGDKLDAEVGVQAAPETYLKLGALKGNPSKGPITVKFDKNPDFYNGSVTIRVRTAEELAAMKTRGIFGGLLGLVNWKGLGLNIAKRAVEVLEAV